MLKKLFAGLAASLLLFTAQPAFPREGFSFDNAALGQPISGYVFVGDTNSFLPVVLTFANPTLIGNTVVVTGVAGKKIRVLSIVVVDTAATTIKFQGNSIDRSAGFPFAANGGFILPFNPQGYFDTLAGETLNVNLSAATPVGVQISYVLI